MTVEIPVGFGQFTFRWTQPGGSGEFNVVMGMKPESSVPVGQDLVDRASLLAADNLNPLRAVNQFYIGCTLLLRLTGGLFRYDSIVGVGTEASQSGAPMPPQVCVLVKKVTALAGRQFRGRMYLLPPGSSHVTANADSIAPTSVTVVQDAMDAFLLGAGTGDPDEDFSWQLLHGKKKLPGDPPGEPSGAAPAPTFITGFVAEAKLATQRGRLRD